MPVAYASEVRNNENLITTISWEQAVQKGFDISKINQTECINPRMMGNNLICVSKDHHLTIYNKNGRAFHLKKIHHNTTSANLIPLKKAATQKQLGASLEERAINGQFDQVKITYAQQEEIWNTPPYGYDWIPDLPDRWNFIGDEDVSMYGVPDCWADESLPETSDIHATVFIFNSGTQSGVNTTLDATWGQNVSVKLDSVAYNDPVGIYLDNIKLGTVQGEDGFAQFDISNRSWTKTSELKVISEKDVYDGYGSVTLVRSISLMAIVSNEQPVASFNTTPQSGNFPLNVSFTDTSTNFPTEWNWSFGDGTFADVQNPMHTYTSAGTYTVGLNASNSAGSNTSVKAGLISISSPMACDASGPYVDFVIEKVSCPDRNSGMWYDAVCTDNARIRWAMAGSSSPFYSNLTNMMWKRNSACPDPGHSWAVDPPANKPIYTVGVYNPDILWWNGQILSHEIDAELMTSEDPTDTVWTSWNFFQYDNLSIPIGDYQIPAGTESIWTKVWIKEITSVYGCALVDETTVRTFYIAPNESVYPHPRDYYTQSNSQHLGINPKLKIQNTPDAIKRQIKTMQTSEIFSINKWEYNEENKELAVYVYNVKDELALQKYTMDPNKGYSIRIIHDSEFEKNRSDIQSQLVQFLNNPAYAIAGISMVTDRNIESPGNYVELWVYNYTQENRRLDNSELDGWKIQVYPVSSPQIRSENGNITK